MEPSLSILLPICNGQSVLRESVLKVLEVAADLTQQLDLLIVDNGSTDQTPEIAHDLAREFPQVLFRRFAARQNLPTIVHSSLACTQGEILFLHEGDGKIDVGDLRNLWQLRHDERLVLARSGGTAAQFAPTTVDRLLRGAAGQIPGGSGFHLIRRDSLDRVRRGAMLQIDNQRVRLRRDLPARRQTTVATRPNFMSRLRRLALSE